MRSSTVAFIHALPQHSDIAITEVDAVQTLEVELPGTVSNMWSVLLLQNVVLSASTLLVSNVKAHATKRDALGLYSTGMLKLVGGSSLYARYCSFDEYTHAFYVYSLSVSDHSVFAMLNNTIFSGVSLLYQQHGFSVSDYSVLRVVGNSGSVRHIISNDELWTVQRSSWLDWRDNNVEVGAMFYETESDFVNIDGSSVVTLTGCKMGSTGLLRPLLSQADAGYRFVAGCLTVAGREVTTAAELELHGITKVTTVASCVVLSASTLLVSNVKAHATKRDALGLYSTGMLKLVGGSSLYARYCSFDEYTHAFYVYSLSVSDHSVFAMLNNTIFSGVSLLYQQHGFSVSDYSVLRVVGNSGSVRHIISNDELWTVQRSSWLDWRDNNVEVGAMFYETESDFVNIDGSSVVTLTGCKMGSTGLLRPLLSQADAG
ncbi:dispersed gene family protein 1 (DGF-1), putative, partial [Trypanosoma cruzi marinkellei]